MSFPPLKIALFADGANKESILRAYKEGIVKGFTTNPTLMNQAGIKDYEQFARSVLEVVTDRPISFEVFADDFPEMERQAKKISSWGKNVNVKIPITNTRKEPSLELIRRLFDQGLKLNITAILTTDQWQSIRHILKPENEAIISIFAGRIADTGRDPIPMMRQAVDDFRAFPKAKILWASPREVLNIYQAQACGCHIITATDEVIKKLALYDRDLSDYSLDTVKMFFNDATKAGFGL